MTRRALIPTVSLVAVIAAVGFVAPAAELDSSGMQVISSDATARYITLGKNKSVVIDLPRDIKDVLVTHPDTADAVVRSNRRAYIIGKAVGQTNVYFYDAVGRQIAALDIAVRSGATSLEEEPQKRIVLFRYDKEAPLRADAQFGSLSCTPDRCMVPQEAPPPPAAPTIIFNIPASAIPASGAR